MSDRLAFFQQLVDIMQTLRSPEGCPWDREQSLETLKPYLIEEAYEVLEAMDGPRQELKEELGDLLLQIVFQSQIAREEGSFDIYDVAHAIGSKMVNRHPHVFGELQVGSSVEVKQNWEQSKREERRKKDPHASVLQGIPRHLPALLQAWRMTEKASRVGFDWPSPEGVRQKIDEELAELDQALASGEPKEIEHELGDLLFSLVNLARVHKLNPEETLRKANLRFKARFEHIERSLGADGLRPEQVDLEELDRRWDAAKRALKSDAQG